MGQRGHRDTDCKAQSKDKSWPSWTRFQTGEVGFRVGLFLAHTWPGSGLSLGDCRGRGAGSGRWLAGAAQQERLVAKPVMLLWERRRSPWQCGWCRRRRTRSKKTWRQISKWRARGLKSWHRLWKIGGRKFSGFCVIYMDSPPYFSVFVDYLVIIGDPANTKRAFPSWG